MTTRHPNDYEDVRYDVTDGVATITIDRPERRNAMRTQTLGEMTDAVQTAGRDATVGVVVVTGAGDHFCGGGDLTMAPEPGSTDVAPPDVEIGLHWMTAFRVCPKPVIGRVQGYCIGMGNELNLLCDLTIAGESAKFGQAGPRVGSVPAVGGTQLLSIVCGLKRAKEIMFLCRTYSGSAAVEMGLANHVVPDDDLDDEVRRWCDELLALSPQSLRIAKLSLSTVLDQQWSSVMHGAELARWFLSGGDIVEGAAAFLEKRPPEWRPAPAGTADREAHTS